MRIKAFIAFFFFILAAGIYSFFVEPFWLEVTHHNFKVEFEHPIKIAHISDLHFGNHFRLEHRVLKEVEKEKPDIIVITGDSYENKSQFKSMERFFLALKAPLGVWGVKGNWENWISVTDETAFWKKLGVNLLVNQKRFAGQNIEIFGYDDESSGQPDRNLTSEKKEPFRICLFHSPAFFDKVSGNCSLALAGHTHGGQVTAPIFGPLWVPDGSANYLKGWYEIGSSRMYVTRGLGTSLIPLRFGARPELAFITLSR